MRGLLDQPDAYLCDHDWGGEELKHLPEPLGTSLVRECRDCPATQLIGPPTRPPRPEVDS